MRFAIKTENISEMNARKAMHMQQVNMHISVIIAALKAIFVISVFSFLFELHTV